MRKQSSGTAGHTAEPFRGIRTADATMTTAYPPDIEAVVSAPLELALTGEPDATGCKGNHPWMRAAFMTGTQTCPIHGSLTTDQLTAKVSSTPRTYIASPFRIRFRRKWYSVACMYSTWASIRPTPLCAYPHHATRLDTHGASLPSTISRALSTVPRRSGPTKSPCFEGYGGAAQAE